MKKSFTLVFMLFSVLSMAMAQGPAMIVNGQVDNESTQVDNVLTNHNGTIDIEIWDCNSWLPFPAEMVYCTPYWTCLMASTWENEEYHYLWSTGSTEWDTSIEYGFGETVVSVQVWDDNGNEGFASVTIIVNDDGFHDPLHVDCYVDAENHPVFSWDINQITEDMYDLMIAIGHDTLSSFAWTTITNLLEGSYTFEEYFVNEENVYGNFCRLRDTCANEIMEGFRVQGSFLERQDNVIKIRSLINEVSSYQFELIGHQGDIFQGEVLETFETDQQEIIISEDYENFQFFCIRCSKKQPGMFSISSFSNSIENYYWSTNEAEMELFSLYPNPAQGRFTVEGTGTVTISNVMGQTVLTRKIDGKETIALPRDMYFVKLGNVTRKIVVE